MRVALFARCDPEGRIAAALARLGCEIVPMEAADALFVYGGPILPRDAFERPRLGAWNFHPSLLPRHRGREPERAVVAAGDRVGGVTLHRITADVDAGSVLLRRRFAVPPGETVESYRARALDAIVAALPDAFARVRDGAPTFDPAARRVLMLLPTTSYRADDLVAAARRAGVEPVLATDRCRRVARMWPEDAWPVEFHRPEEAADAICDLARAEPLAAIVPTDDLTAVVAALAGARLGLPHNPPDAARAARDKLAMRVRLAAAGVPQPAFRAVEVAADPAAEAAATGYPCVLKPRALSASRGVIRADSPAEFTAAFARVRRILAEPAVAKKGGELARSLLVESYVEGAEVAVEAIVTRGSLHVLTIFDKPDPLRGPHFEETIYLAPSRLPDGAQRAIADVTARAAAAIGIAHGPVHAELRIDDAGPAVIEVAARTIGGLCSRALRFSTGASLEDVVVRHAMGADALPRREARASGVMMIPVPRDGVLRGVSGVEDARGVPLVEGVEITARAGDRLAPPPEGGAEYLGFLFARGDDPAAVEAALRAAHARLAFEIAPALPPA